ncbi:MAG: efflux RND transporter periplasmic adaptor subunit [Muribaculum sp.]|nr:efflux RND transporter periplasmic adaptor subunit [Muribaculum sp.]
MKVYAAAIISFIILTMLISCKEKEQTFSTDENKGISINAGDDVLVDTIMATLLPFSADIISNGRVHACEYAEIYFRNTEIISNVHVKNGQRVRAGQPLASLDVFKLNGDKIKRETAVKQAELEMQDVLIGQGYDPSDLKGVPGEVMELARVRSGLDLAEASYKETLHDIENATVAAPFDGVVANVKMRAHSMSSVSEPFCMVVNDKVVSVEFPVLESELPFIEKGMDIEVTPFHGGVTHSGTVTEINPRVEENGQILLRASISGNIGLMDGMNVRVRSKKNLSPRLAVPKSAVVLRTGRQVVFTIDDEKAKWNYVTTGLENLDKYEITDGLMPGDIVIVSGNENLANGSPVKVGQSHITR